MNEVIKNIFERRTVRFFTDAPVKDEDIETLLECAKVTPSALNRQPWHFTVLRDRALMDEISVANKEIMLNSGDPVMIEKANEPDFDSFRTSKTAILISSENAAPYGMADCANAAMIMTLVATSLGLGSCYIAGFNNVLRKPEGADFRARLKTPEGYTPIFGVCLGYIAEQPKPRKPLKPETVTYIG
jgi:nitroreductase